MFITKIEIQKKNKERFNIYVDKGQGQGEEYAFSVDQDTFIKYELRKGKELDDLFLTEVLFYEDTRKATLMAINYLSYQMRTAKEVYTYLVEKEVSIPIIQEVLTSLKQQRYLDDKEYAYAFVRTQCNISLKGPTVVKSELKEKGVTNDIIEDAIEQFYPFDKQVENAEKWLRKKTKGIQRHSIKELENKMKNYLMTKGFGWDAINIVMETLEGDREQELDALRIQAEKYHRKYAKFEGWEYENKMKSALYRKGFKMEDIEIVLGEMREE
ncbi:MAG: recombination regulator RecX [Bacillaceae bacterium]